MIEIVFLLFLHLVCFPIGIVLSSVTSGHGGNCTLVGGIIGYGVISVLSHILYKLGFPASYLIVGFSLLSAGSILFIVAHRRQLLNINSKGALLYLGVLSLLISPALIGGGQFVIFQGNSYDHFNYLQAAISYQDHNYAYLRDVQIEKILKDPLVESGSGSLRSRPAVMILYAVVSYWFRSSVIQLPYIYLCFFMAQSILALIWISRCVLGEGKHWLAILVSGAFGLGFWGQYLIDQNWWSQISATPVLMVLVYEVIRRSIMKEQLFIKEGIFLGLLLLSSIYLYSPALVFLAPGLLVMWLLAFQRPPILFLQMLGIGVLCICIAYFNDNDLIHHVFHQASSLSPATFPSAIYGYHGYFIFGKDGISSQLLEPLFSLPVKEGFIFGSSESIIAELVDVIAGLAGMFFLTPGASDEPWNAAVIRLLLTFFIAASIFSVLQSLRRQSGNKIIRSYVIFFIVQIAIIAVLMANGGYYGVLKGYFYLAAVCFPILCFSAVTKKPSSTRNLLVIFFSIQLLFGGVRLYAAANPTGVHYKFPPYPSANLASRKSAYSWDISLYAEKLINCNGVKITDTFDNGFYEKFAQLLMKQNNIPYFLEGPVRKNYGVGDSIRGYMPKIEYDCVVSQSVRGNPRTFIITKS